MPRIIFFVFLSIFVVTSLLGEYYIFVSDTNTIVDSCGCDTCSFGTECDSLRSAVAIISGHCPAVGIADRKWLRAYHLCQANHIFAALRGRHRRQEMASARKSLMIEQFSCASARCSSLSRRMVDILSNNI